MADLDPEAAGVLVETFRRTWEDGGAVVRLGSHEPTFGGVAFTLVGPASPSGPTVAEIIFTWAEIMGAVANISRLGALKGRADVRFAASKPVVLGSSDPQAEGHRLGPLPPPTHRLGRSRRIH